MATKRVEIIGEKNWYFWLYSEADGYDLTHPPTADSPPIQPRLSLRTTTDRVTIDPDKTALVIVDLQNYFLSPLLGRPTDSAGLKVVDRLIKHVIPSCRKAGIQLMWMGWGFEEEAIEELPPAIIRGFAADTNFENGKKPVPLGSEIGPLELGYGEVIDGGRIMMRDQWNTAFYPTLADAAEPHDTWVYKNSPSGFAAWDRMVNAPVPGRIETLLFSGANTDQSVARSLQDALAMEYDCLLLSDACATTSPEFCKQCVEYNCEVGGAFVLSCKDLADGVDNMLASEKDRNSPDN